MLEVKRGPGRPPKVRPEVEIVEPVATEVAKVEGERLIEVELIRKYVPDGQPQEIKQSIPPGTVAKLPQSEATRLLKMGYAHATDRTFS